MKHAAFGIPAAAAVCFFISCLSGCSYTNDAAPTLKLTAPDDIVTLEPPAPGKDVIRVGLGCYVDYTRLKDALEARFHDKTFVFDYYVNAGNDVIASCLPHIIGKQTYDLMIVNNSEAAAFGTDISDESFLNRYLLSAINNMSINGHVYGIPLPASAGGIFYNKHMFAEHGWSIPHDDQEFISLCRTIRKAGITPFYCCTKYPAETLRLLEGMTYNALFLSPESVQWYSSLCDGKAVFTGHIEPMFDLARRLSDEHIISSDYFTSSLTEMRRDFFAGKAAMISYSSNLYNLSIGERCPFPVAMMPYPQIAGSPCIIYTQRITAAIPSDIRDDKKRFQFALSVLDYLSTEEGQRAELTAWDGISSFNGYVCSAKSYRDTGSIIKAGDYHPALAFTANNSSKLTEITLINDAVKAMLFGKSRDDVISDLDNSYNRLILNVEPPRKRIVIAEAKTDFTVLETSYYLADKIRETAGTDIGLMADGGYFCSNLASIARGPVTDDTSLFVLKGINEKAPLTVYSLTGAQLKLLLEYPVINGADADQFIAASGLAITYAPWHTRGNRVVSVCMEDGTKISDAKLYTAAAYPGIIADKYITGKISEMPAAGSLAQLAAASLEKDKIITPDTEQRLKLVWK